MYTSVQSFETEQGGGDSFTVHAEVCTYEANGVDVSASEITVEPPPMPPPGPAYVGPDGQPIYGHQVPAGGSCSYYPQSQPYPGQYAPPPPGMMYGGTPFAGAVGDGVLGGEQGLGEMGALGVAVRPFRRVFVGQSLFRREVYQ